MSAPPSAPQPLRLLQRRVRTPAAADAAPPPPAAWWWRWMAWGMPKAH